MAMDGFAYATPCSIEEALEVLNDECRPMAGGIDLLGMMKEELIAPGKLVSLQQIPGLDQVREEQGKLHIGALTPMSRLMAHPAIRQRQELACLHQALLETASPQIRHRATIGGNLLQRPRCWYFRHRLTYCLRKGGRQCFAFRGENRHHAILGGGPCYIVHPSDPATALIAVDASVTIAGRGGTRSLSLADLYLLPRQDAHREAALAPDELLTEIIVPTPEVGSRGVYIKVPEHGARDFALVSVAAQVQLSEGTVRQVRVVLGGVAPAPWRSHGVEEALQGHPLSDQAIEQAAQAATAGARPLAQNAYKVSLAQNLVRQALQGVR